MNTKFVGAVAGIIAVALIGAIIVFALRQSAPETPTVPDGQSADQQDASVAQKPEDTQNENGDAEVETEEATIGIEDFAFQPATITVKRGATVTWENKDAIQHDVTSDDGVENGPQSELLAEGKNYSFTFNKVGEFTYHCSPHPYMEGKVIVIE